MFETIIIVLSCFLGAYSLGALAVILFYLKATHKPAWIALIAGVADILYMTSALWEMIIEEPQPDDFLVWVRLIAFILSAVAFNRVHKLLEKPK